jgi:predicted ATPase
VQVFVESHSEHILNGLRIATITNETQTKILDKEDVSILYFDNSETYFKQIKILEDNDLSVWADDFFDQTNKDYKTIYGY